MIPSIRVLRGAACVVATVTVPVAAAPQQRVPASSARTTAVQSSPPRALRNPRTLTAVQLLEPTHPGRTPPVRVEWDPVPEASEYLLYGQWVSAESWAVQTREFHVTPRAATAWEAERIAFDVALPEGSHSWNLVALRTPKDSADFVNPTAISFELR